MCDSKGFRFVRMADRDKVCRGNMYAKCPDCGNMVLMQPWERCSCGHVAVDDVPGGRIAVVGGRDPIGLYMAEPGYVPEDKPCRDVPLKKKRFRFRKMDLITAALFVLAVLSVLYAKMDGTVNGL